MNVADLSGAAVGQTTGTSITLDTNAAGNNWFIDSTPADNSEFLPTADPNVWMAKADSAAAGKMDMLSVLLHEYGHALGIEHSADPSDFMNATLQPGERRLPTADELALMQQLIAQAKGETTSVASVDNSSPANVPIPLDLPLGGSLIGLAGFMGRRYTQYEVAANAAFTSLDTASGWNTQGGVDIAAATLDPSTGSGQMASATLREVANSQTRLNQMFMLGDSDRYLTFTLSGPALSGFNPLPNPLPQAGEGANVAASGSTNGPRDAFQVALLDASTGDSLLGSDGQTRTDAFLNLQAYGKQNMADCVTCIDNADGTRTYRVDLANVPKNIAVNLSFDLIGFGANDSHITVSDVRVSGLPQLADSTATMLENGTLQLDPLAPVRGTGITSFMPAMVTDPAHGSIAINTDGTFTYTPVAGYNGTDSFSYCLKDGTLSSNVATVSLSLTSVNSAPTGTSSTVTTLEDTQYVFKAADFGFSDAVDALSAAGANNFANVIIDSLPLAGNLMLNGVAVIAGQSISLADINAGICL